MTWGIVLFFAVIAITAAIALWGVISPRSQWHAMQAWAFRNPEANEPSDAAYALTRVGSAVALIIIVVALVGLWSTFVG